MANAPDSEAAAEEGSPLVVIEVKHREVEMNGETFFSLPPGGRGGGGGGGGNSSE